MRNDKLVPGLILVMIGAIFLLHNFHVIHFYWGNLFHLWPIFLVIGGVNLVFANNRSPWATILKISVVIAGFALLVFGNFNDRGRWWWPHYYYNSSNDKDDDSSDNSSNNDNDDDNSGKGSSVFNEPFNTTVKVARLNINGGATTYNLNDTTDQLFNAKTKEAFGKYELNNHQEDSVYVVDFNMRDKDGGWGSEKDNRVDMKLNPNPEWEFVLNAGATELNFDLSKFKVRSLEVNGGAASFNLKLGQPLASTNVNITTGAASVNISIPRNAECQITRDSPFSSGDFEGFTKKTDGSYQTAGFNTAKKKIYIHFGGAVSGFEVKRY